MVVARRLSRRMGWRVKRQVGRWRYWCRRRSVGVVVVGRWHGGVVVVGNGECFGCRDMVGGEEGENGEEEERKERFGESESHGMSGIE